MGKYRMRKSHRLEMASFCRSLLILPSVLSWSLASGTVVAEGLSGTIYHNHRTDTKLIATYGSCYADEFRHVALLDASRWDETRWTVAGNLYAGHAKYLGITSFDWPLGSPNYARKLTLSVNGEKISTDAMQIEEVEHQFDFRKIAGETDAIALEKADIVISSLQWITAFKLHNKTDQDCHVTLELETTDGECAGCGCPAPGGGIV